MASAMVGVGPWLVYGILLGEMPLIAANAITFTLALLILTMRIRYGGRNGSGHKQNPP